MTVETTTGSGLYTDLHTEETSIDSHTEDSWHTEETPAILNLIDEVFLYVVLGISISLVIIFLLVNIIGMKRMSRRVTCRYSDRPLPNIPAEYEEITPNRQYEEINPNRQYEKISPNIQHEYLMQKIIDQVDSNYEPPVPVHCRCSQVDLLPMAPPIPSLIIMSGDNDGYEPPLVCSLSPDDIKNNYAELDYGKVTESRSSSCGALNIDHPELIQSPVFINKNPETGIYTTSTTFFIGSRRRTQSN